MTTATVYKFGPFILNPSKREFYKDAHKLKLSNRDFDVLLYLIENRPKVSSINEIIEAVWGETNVENNSVEKAIVNLRNLLEDDKKDPRFIKNVRTKGYLFIGDVQEVDESLVPDHFFKKEDPLPKLAKLKSKTVSIYLGFFILLGIFGLFWWKGGEIWARLNSKIIFADDFSGNEIDKARWLAQGKTVKVENGIAKLSTDETDNWGRLFSPYFSIDPNKIITIRSRIKVAYSHNLKSKVYFVGGFGFVPETSFSNDAEIRDNTLRGIKYVNYDYDTTYSNGDIKYQSSEGFFLVRDGGRPHVNMDYQNGKVSSRIEPVWDKWFDQTLVYEPYSGKMSYFINGVLKDEFNTGKFTTDLSENKLRLEIIPWGWWLHHSIELDYIEVSQ